MKVVFILGSASERRCFKRIREFIEHGYEVDTYAFKRDEKVSVEDNIPIQIIGSFSNNDAYIHRVPTLFKAVKNVTSLYKNDSSVFYYVYGLELCMMFRLVSRAPYIYDEGDMVHTNFSSKLLASIFEWIDKRVIKNSLFTIFASEGFPLYHFGNKIPSNSYVIPNKLDSSICNITTNITKQHDRDNLSIGYVGYLRYDSIRKFAEYFVKNFPKNTFHFWGVPTNSQIEQSFSELKKYSNCIFHGAFKTPNDLSEIYSKIDLVLSTYDVSSVNVRYAEPNKLYEAIYFRTPIIVSSNTFLAEKVKKLDVGYDVNALDEKEVVGFVNRLLLNGWVDKIKSIEKIDRNEAINNNTEFFEILSKKIKA